MSDQQILSQPFAPAAKEEVSCASWLTSAVHNLGLETVYVSIRLDGSVTIPVSQNGTGFTDNLPVSTGAPLLKVGLQAAPKPPGIKQLEVY